MKLKNLVLLEILASCFLTHPLWSQETRQKLLPDISVISTFSGAYFSQDPVAGTTGHDPAQTGFNLQEIEVAFQSVIDPYLRGDIFLSFQTAGVELEEGLITTLGLSRGFQIRAGKFLLPFGRHNQKHLELLDFVDNNLVNKYLLGPEALNELGVEVSYLFPTPFFLQAQATLSNGDNATSFAGTRRQDLLYQGRLSTSFDFFNDITLLVGGSGAFGANGTGLGNQTRILGGDVLLKWKPKAYRSLTWQSEYIHRWRQTPGASPQDGGLYSYVNYQFARRWHAGLRYDYFGLPAESLTKEWRLTPALTFNPTEFSRVRIQYEYDKPTGAQTIQAAFLQFEFSMGPHGAHAF